MIYGKVYPQNPFRIVWRLPLANIIPWDVLLYSSQNVHQKPALIIIEPSKDPVKGNPQNPILIMKAPLL